MIEYIRLLLLISYLELSTGCAWVPTINSNSPGGSANNAMNLGQCQSNCINQPSGCQYGFDWNPNNTPGNQCFLSNYPTVNVGAFPNVVHYQLVCATSKYLCFVYRFFQIIIINNNNDNLKHIPRS